MGGWSRMFRTAPLIVVFALAGCSDDIIGDAPSPDGAYRAVEFTSSRVATASGSYHVSILTKNEPIGPSANAFTFDSNREVAPSLLKISWLNSREVEFTYDKRVRIFKREATVHGVTIHYKPILIQ